MKLSLNNRRRAQTSSAWVAHQQSSIVTQTHFLQQHQQKLQQHQQQQQQFRINKQNSFIETSTRHRTHTNISNTSCSIARGDYLTRGVSVDRSLESIRQKFIVPVSRKYNTNNLQKHISIDQESRRRTLSRSKDQQLKIQKNSPSSVSNAHRFNNNNAYQNSCGGIGVTLRERNISAWSSTSSLLKALDSECVQQVNGGGILDRKKAFINSSADVFENKEILCNGDHSKFTSSSKSGDNSKINLNIVLSQTIKAITEHETAHSDIDSSSECADIVLPVPEKRSDLPTTKAAISNSNTSNNQQISTSVAQQRRAQFRSSRNTLVNATTVGATTASTISIAATISTSTATTTTSSSSSSSSVVQNNIYNNSNNFTASPSLSVQRRPPLVRAMSAPVRSFDENSKNVINAANKRRTVSRRRRLISRNIGCNEKIDGTENKLKDFNLDNEINGNGKKVLSRTRSTVAVDVITLVSLVSSEGSDSDREDTSTTTTETNSDHSPTRRAPSLRKTGKSVSFQENFPPNFQLAPKDYSMIRRGSIAPLAARIRANRPPTAPPVSIYLSESHTISDTMSSSSSANQPNGSSKIATTTKTEKENNASSDNISATDYVFPDYVRSIKERECWKLHQKMSAKGVSVSYDTVLRGMLTPTEFRQIQKQREVEEAKARAAEEAAATKEAENVKPKISAIERLSETLLKK